MAQNLITLYSVRITKQNSHKINLDRFNAYKSYYESRGITADNIPDRIGGMAYYYDKNQTSFHGIDPYHHIRKSKVQHFSGWAFWCEVVPAIL